MQIKITFTSRPISRLARQLGRRSLSNLLLLLAASAVSLASALTAAASGGTNVFDLAADFSANNNPNGPWTYIGVGVDHNFYTLTNFGPAGGINGWNLPSNPNEINPAVIGLSPYFAGTLWCVCPTIFVSPRTPPSTVQGLVERFTLPPGADGTYQLKAAMYPGPSEGLAVNTVTVAKNGQTLFALQQIDPNLPETSMSTNLTLAAGDVLDFEQDFGLSPTIDLQIEAVISQPAPADLSLDFSTNSNPNGVWCYGWETSLGGPFSLFQQTGVLLDANQVPVESWSTGATNSAAVLRNASDQTSTLYGVQGVFTPGATWFYPGLNSESQNYAVIRFTAPAGGAGQYSIDANALAYLAGAGSRTTDFHILLDGFEVFGESIQVTGGASPLSGASYSNTVQLVDGDTLDFVVGPGSAPALADTGLLIEALVSRISVVAPPSPPVISTQPQSQSALLGGSATFTVVVTNSGTVAFQWEFDGNPLPGQTASALALTNITAAQAGNYAVVITNAGGMVRSSVVQLTVSSAILATDANVTSSSIARFGFGLNASVEPGLSYRVQASTDLVTWTTISQFTSGSTQTRIVDTQASGYPMRFYRVVSP
jgi:hypothetical protein